MSLFQVGDFQGHSGRRLTWKVECDALTVVDWQDLASIAFHEGLVRPFGVVEGVPSGGLILAKALVQYKTRGHPGLLIVDDVLTTGGSMEVHRAGREAQGLVIFARGPCPSWITALWQWGGKVAESP